MPPRRQVALTLVVLVLAVPVLIVVHELGHVALARALGDPTASFVLTRVGDDGHRSYGVTTYDATRFPSVWIPAINVAGVTATSLVAGALFLLRARLRPGGGARAALTGAWATFATDLPAQFLQAAAPLPYPWRGGTDLAALATNVGWASEPALLRVGLLAAAAVVVLAWAVALRRMRGARAGTASRLGKPDAAV